MFLGACDPFSFQGFVFFVFFVVKNSFANLLCGFGQADGLSREILTANGRKCWVERVLR